MNTLVDDVEVDEEEETCPECGDEEDSYGNCGCPTCSYCDEKMQGWGSICSICEEACSTCCSCCSECGYSSCECCSECGYSSCECSSNEFGQSDRAGWEVRGVKAHARSATDQWRQVWPEVDSENFDLCQEAADFYLLEAITNGFVNSDKAFITIEKQATPEELLAIIGVEDKRTIEFLTALRDDFIENEPNKIPHPLEITLSNVIDEANVLFSRKVENADNVFRAYFHMAVAGEARHHQAIKSRILSGNRDRAWSGWRSIYEQVGPEALMDLHDLFLEFGGGAYGGPPWAEACKILYSREMGTLGPTEFLNRKMFVDRAWTLEHNGGCFLNKICWGVQNSKGWAMDMLKDKILNSHAANPPAYKFLLKVASPEVADLWDQVWDINNELNGTKNLNPHNVHAQYRYLCNGCEGDPQVGHYANCWVYQNDDFDVVVNKKQVKSWYRMVEDDDWGRYNWTRWENTAKEAPFMADFTLRDLSDVDVNVTWRIQINMSVEGRDTTKYPYKHNTIYYHHWDVPFKSDELEEFMVDPSAVTQGFAKAAYDHAIHEYTCYYGEVKKPFKKEDLRIIPLSARIQYLSSLVPKWQAIHVQDPFNTKAPKVAINNVGLGHLKEASRLAAKQIDLVKTTLLRWEFNDTSIANL